MAVDALTTERTAVRDGSIVCPEKSPPLFFSKSEYFSARAMVTVPSDSCQLWRARRRKPFPCRGIDAPTTARIGICRLMGFSPTFGTRRFLKGERKALFPAGGWTRRLRRGWWGCRPEGGSTFFRSERKYQRKHAARRLREKALYCPFLKEGVRNVARSIVG